MSSLRTVLSTTAIAAVLGFGFGTWIVMSAGKERRKELVKSLPESDPRKMEEMRKRNTLVMLALKEAAENKDNIARN